MLAAVAAWEWAESAGPADEVVILARAALEDSAAIIADAPERIAGAILALALADLDEAVDRLDAIRAEAHRSGFVFTMLAYRLWGGYAVPARRARRAEVELRSALATAARWGYQLNSRGLRPSLPKSWSNGCPSRSSRAARRLRSAKPTPTRRCSWIARGCVSCLPRKVR